MTNRGFTLVELVLVLVIVMTLLTIAGIAGRDWMVRSEVEKQTRMLYVDLMNARAAALQNNRAHFVALTTNQYSIYEDTFDAPDGNGELNTGAGQDRLVSRTNVRYPLSDFAATVTFSASGLVSPNGRINIVSDVNPLINCISMMATRVRTGKRNGANCDAQ